LFPVLKDIPHFLLLTLRKKGADSLVRAIQTRLEFKILLLLIAVLLVGFGTYAILSAPLRPTVADSPSDEVI